MSLKKEEDIYSLIEENDHIKMAIWDFDGTIVDSESIHKMTYREVLSSLGVETDGDFFSKYIGQNEWQIWQGLQEEFGFAGDVDHLREQRLEIAIPRLLIKRPNWFVRPILDALRSKRVPSLIVSSGNRPVIDRYLGYWRIQNHFERISAQEKEGPLKSDKLSKLLSEEVLFIEDSLDWIETADDAGAVCIGVFSDLPERAVDFWVKPGQR